MLGSCSQKVIVEGETVGNVITLIQGLKTAVCFLSAFTACLVAVSICLEAKIAWKKEYDRQHLCLIYCRSNF